VSCGRGLCGLATVDQGGCQFIVSVSRGARIEEEFHSKRAKVVQSELLTLDCAAVTHVDNDLQIYRPGDI
jgi:hypothetical protein